MYIVTKTCTCTCKYVNNNYMYIKLCNIKTRFNNIILCDSGVQINVILLHVTYFCTSLKINFSQTLTCIFNCLSFHHFVQEFNEIWYLLSLTKHVALHGHKPSLT